MDKIQKFFKNIGQFFNSLFGLTNYVETQEQVSNSLSKISEKLITLQETMDGISNELNKTSEKMDGLSEELTKVKDGLQLELFRSLQQLYERYSERGWAAPEEKLDAKQFYDEIHILGKDGWSKKYYDEIIALPESKEQYYKTK